MSTAVHSAARSAARPLIRASLTRESGGLLGILHQPHRGDVAPELAAARKQLWREVPMLLTVLLTIALTVWL